MIDTTRLKAAGMLTFTNPDMVGIIVNALTPFNSTDIATLELHTTDATTDFLASAQVSEMTDVVISILGQADPTMVVEEISKVNPLHATGSMDDILHHMTDTFTVDGEEFTHITGITGEDANDDFTLMGSVMKVTSDGLNGTFTSKVFYRPFQLPSMSDLTEHFARHETMREIH